MVVLRLSPCLECSLCSFGNFPGVWSLKAWSPRTMEPTLSSETSAFILRTPGKFPKEHRLHFFFYFAAAPQGATASSFTRFPDHTQRSTKVGRTPLVEWSARRRDPYLTTHNTRNRQTFVPQWDSTPQSQQASAASDLRLRPRGHWDQQSYFST